MINFLCLLLCSVPTGGSIEECPDSYMQQEMKEVLSLKCTRENLGYILSKLERHGFKIINISFSEGVKPICIVNYSH